MSISKRLRFEILTRDEHTCRYCGGRAPDVVLQVDHVLAVSLGGTDDPSNLTAACKDCNAGKSSVKPGSPMVDQVNSDAMRWARAIEYATDRRSLAIEELEADCARFDARWCDWTSSYTNKPVQRDPDWRNSLEVWIKRGVTIEVLCHYVDKAMGRPNLRHGDIWRYYCGIIWKFVSELDKEAAALLRDEAYPEFEQLADLKVVAE